MRRTLFQHSRRQRRLMYLNEDDNACGRWYDLGLRSSLSRWQCYVYLALTRQRRSATGMRPTVSRWVYMARRESAGGQRVGTTSGHRDARDSLSLSPSQSSVSYRCRGCDRACSEDLDVSSLSYQVSAATTTTKKKKIWLQLTMTFYVCIFAKTATSDPFTESSTCPFVHLFAYYLFTWLRSCFSPSNIQLQFVSYARQCCKMQLESTEKEEWEGREEREGRRKGGKRKWREGKGSYLALQTIRG